MANLTSDQATIASTTPTSSKKRSIRFVVATSAFLLLLLTAGVFYLFPSKSSASRNDEVYANADGSVEQVQNYLKQNILADPDSFTPIHWSKLQKKSVFGTISYKVGLIYKAKNNKNEIIMTSKLFELDEKGTVLLVMDSGPMNIQ
ncbi:MAG: hypothetical protein EOO10_18515 [Chitinophagaceae bacterium]|nr:MAG: hypothetical protein EOO10_18515 [Chitinophagaceae bacterium]